MYDVCAGEQRYQIPWTSWSYRWLLAALIQILGLELWSFEYLKCS